MDNKTYINKGLIKKTLNQKKKHFTQMTKEEKLYLVNKLKNINLFELTLSYHLMDKKITFNPNSIFKVMTCDNLENCIIEYNETETKNILDIRVLLRALFKEPTIVIEDNQEKKCEANLCFVISILSKRIVTIYYNISEDNHQTIDWDRYDKNLKIIK